MWMLAIQHHMQELGFYLTFCVDFHAKKTKMAKKTTTKIIFLHFFDTFYSNFPHWIVKFLHNFIHCHFCYCPVTSNHSIAADFNSLFNHKIDKLFFENIENKFRFLNDSKEFKSESIELSGSR
jgi:hypothetical protein